MCPLLRVLGAMHLGTETVPLACGITDSLSHRAVVMQMVAGAGLGMGALAVGAFLKPASSRAKGGSGADTGTPTYAPLQSTCTRAMAVPPTLCCIAHVSRHIEGNRARQDTVLLCHAVRLESRASGWSP